MYQKPEEKKMCGNTWNARNQSGKSRIKKKVKLKRRGETIRGKKKVAKNV